MKIGVLTLGCPKNLADMANFKGILKKRGHRIVDNALDADVMIIDTCGFIEEAKKESIEEILGFCSLKEDKPSLRVIAVGCLVQRYFNELKEEIPELDGLVGVTSPKKLADLIENGTFFYLDEPDGVYSFEVREKSETYAYVKIGDGCDRNCAFCSIPAFKGRSRSRKLEDIITEIKGLISNGTKEIILVSQDTTQYGIDLYNKQTLPELLKHIDKLEGEFWVRVMYLHPDHLTADIIDTMAVSRKVVKYFDVPVQSGSNAILQSMGRWRKREELIQLFQEIRNRIPEAVLRTTIMVGFPGETQDSFAETLEFVRQVRFNKLGGFVYSPEEGTKAYNMGLTMDKEVAFKLLEQLLEEQEQISYELNRKFLNKRLKVLVEEMNEEFLVGRSWHFSPEIDGNIFVKGRGKPGEYVEALITEAYENDLEGVVVDEHT
ncbi:30S ribosomal protein S12 methylthiotransferase RimO [Kosmotoga pacifica]|uniref:Ribosomal protein uS12 methylthiotransferase RimO n=1 Tax=Kosmotoga pacifica TaxID=1330330 RepID=A0A0G2Z5Z7_9BACT|nr:30S ribosomal protein S12 methylthiotransferase RimO [Kosmotoga pacifica]AKI96962.1 ribosomal protein S12 methylthiotransferase RimO [Kosmotoga pacifica]